jgi:PadR family transcriptional regulator, regulatory protein PadR
MWLPGTLDMLILKTLSGGAHHGYAIARHIQETSKDLLRVEEGTLYPALHRMEGKGWITSEWAPSENNRQARFYKLTRAGRRQLQDEATSWAQLSAAIARVMEAT